MYFDVLGESNDHFYSVSFSPLFDALLELDDFFFGPLVMLYMYFIRFVY